MTRPGFAPSRRLSTENARRLRATALSLALTIVLLTAGLGYAMHESWLRHLDAHQQRISDVTAAAAASLQRRIDAVNRALIDLTVVAGDAFSGAAPRDPDGLHARLQELSRANPDVNRFGIRDADGMIVASSDRSMRGMPPATGSGAVEAHRSRRATGLAISHPVMQASSGTVVVVFSRAVRDAEGRLLGIVAATMPSALLLDEIAGLRHLPTQLALMRDDGVVLQRRGPAAIADDASSRRLVAVLAEAALGRRTADAALDGRPGQLAWQALQGHPLTVVASVARDDLIDDFRRNVRLSFLVAGSILIAVGALAVWLIAMMRSHLQRLEAESRSLESRFRDGIESMADGVLLFDAEDRLIAWNRRFMEMIPHRPGRLAVGVHARDLIAAGHLAIRPGEDPAIVEAAVEARMRARRSLEGTELRTFKGRIIEVADRRTSDGGLVSIFRDVTDERRLIEQLSLSEGRFHDFADAASDWFWESGPDHRFTYLSAGLRNLGTEPAEMIGRTRDEYARLRGAEPPPELVELSAMLGRHEVIRGFCYPSPPDRDGNSRMLELHAKPVFDEAGVFLGYRGIGRDVTLRNRQQAELARALAAEREMNAQQRRFVSIASHEFRTPLAVIDGATQRLQSRLAGADDETHKRLDRIRGAVSRMTELIERTLSSARLDEGRIEPDIRSFDLSQLLREVGDRQRQISPAFEILLDGIDGALPVDGDAKLLEQVFTNLLSNAVKYSARARRIEVAALASADAVRVSVRDHGVGVPPDEAPQLFTRFFRARTSVGIPGTGIGLHLVRELVQMHGGAIDVASEVGKGSTFTVSLPRWHRTVVAAQ